MTPSRNKAMQKFNCGCSHKTLRLHLLHRDSPEKKLSTTKSLKQDTNKSKPILFRPYDLDRKVNQETKPFSNSYTNHCQYPQIADNSTFPLPYYSYHRYAYQQTAQQSEEEYAFKLQRHRAALFIKHVLQFYEYGNGWPSVHPNAIKNPQFYEYNC